MTRAQERFLYFCAAVQINSVHSSVFPEKEIFQTVALFALLTLMRLNLAHPTHYLCKI